MGVITDMPSGILRWASQLWEYWASAMPR